MWVITGDKQETAINIAIACKLIRRPDSLLICNASSKEEAHARLQQLKQQLSQSYAPVGGPPKPTPFSGDPPLQHLRTIRVHACSDAGFLECNAEAAVQLFYAFMGQLAHARCE